jgi:hypothetical protein
MPTAISSSRAVRHPSADRGDGVRPTPSWTNSGAGAASETDYERLFHRVVNLLPDPIGLAPRVVPKG